MKKNPLLPFTLWAYLDRSNSFLRAKKDSCQKRQNNRNTSPLCLARGLAMERNHYAFKRRATQVDRNRLTWTRQG